MSSIVSFIISHWKILLIVIVIAIPSMQAMSWLNGDQNQIFEQYIDQSNSKLAQEVKSSTFNCSNRVIYVDLPLMINALGPVRGRLLESTFQKELINDGVISEMPSEVGIIAYMKDSLKQIMNPLALSNDSFFGGIRVKQNTTTKVQLTTIPDGNYLLFITSDNPQLLEVNYEDLKCQDIELCAKKKGITSINLMLITSSGTQITKENIEVK